MTTTQHAFDTGVAAMREHLEQASAELRAISWRDGDAPEHVGVARACVSLALIELAGIKTQSGPCVPHFGES